MVKGIMVLNLGKVLMLPCLHSNNLIQAPLLFSNKPHLLNHILQCNKFLRLPRRIQVISQALLSISMRYHHLHHLHMPLFSMVHRIKVEC